MGMPQFTAEASLYRGGSYRAGAGGMPSAGVSAQRVIPANGCPPGYWCCRFWGGWRGCVRCQITFFGRCISNQEDTCNRVGGEPANCY